MQFAHFQTASAHQRVSSRQQHMTAQAKALHTAWCNQQLQKLGGRTPDAPWMLFRDSEANGPFQNPAFVAAMASKSGSINSSTHLAMHAPVISIQHLAFFSFKVG
eukprot:gene12687-15919_t